SALDDVLDKVKAFDVGGSDYISKPFHTAEVISRIDNQINLRALQVKLNEKNLFLQKTLEDLKAAQVQQIQNEKMFALGYLVAGIAHEVNNPVSFIYGNLEYVGEYLRDLINLVEAYQQEYPHPGEKIQKIEKEIDLDFLVKDSQSLMGAMYRGADRIRSIVVALQNFSRHDQALHKRVNIHQGIESTLLMLQHRFKKTNYRHEIEIIKEYGDLSPITCYPSELNQVFMHLLNNAVDTLDELAENFQAKRKPENLNKTYSISISTNATDCGDFARISIADNGMGVPDRIRQYIFDPFFTTKPVGKGSGLGLSICYQVIVQKHSGKILCNSTPGEGTEFIIEIPTELIRNLPTTEEKTRANI
ncbi:MAG: ATP-binding protein, partial [Rivularia sp. ALOHA_DT_140]|nr:ATP-binding protein [Rivularia sp. ALOHA_DT_140]